MDRVEHKVVNVSLTSLEESVLYCSERQTDSLVRTFRDRSRFGVKSYDLPNL